MRLEHLIKYEYQHLTFVTKIDREFVFNFNAYKLILLEPLTKVYKSSFPTYFDNPELNEKANDLINLIKHHSAIYIAGNNDLELFNESVLKSECKWELPLKKLKLIVSDPQYFKGQLLQSPLLFLSESRKKLINYINVVNDSLSLKYYKRI